MKKIYCEYSGFLNPKEVENYPEIELFYMIYIIKSILYIIKLEGSNIDISEDLYALDYCIYQTKKYGVDIQKPLNDEYLSENESFKLWYNWWYTYFKYDLPYNVWLSCRETEYQNCNIDLFRPQGNWKKELKKSF